jgi:hypothetical protein
VLQATLNQMLSAIFARMENRTLEDDIAAQQAAEEEAEQRASLLVVKGTVLRDRFRKCWRKLTDLGFNKTCFWFFRRDLWFLVEIKNILSGKCENHPDSLCNPINLVTELKAKPFLPMNVSFYEQPIRGSVCFVYANRSKAMTIIRAPGEEIYLTKQSL